MITLFVWFERKSKKQVGRWFGNYWILHIEGSLSGILINSRWWKNQVKFIYLISNMMCKIQNYIYDIEFINLFFDVLANYSTTYFCHTVHSLKLAQLFSRIFYETELQILIDPLPVDVGKTNCVLWYFWGRRECHLSILFLLFDGIWS